jgi:hypothetical protein
LGYAGFSLVARSKMEITPRAQILRSSVAITRKSLEYSGHVNFIEIVAEVEKT